MKALSHPVKRFLQLLPRPIEGTKPESIFPPSGYYRGVYDSIVNYLESQGRSKREALEEAVGGGFETYGCILRDCVLALGYRGDCFLLDIGCGSGRLTGKLLDIVTEEGTYLGLDVNPNLIDEAKRRILNSPFRSRFRFETLESPLLPCPDRSIDYAVAFSVATHIEVEDTYAYFVELARVLKSEGKAAVTFFSTEIEDHWKIFLEEASRSVEERGRQIRNHVFVPGTLNRLAEKAGLAVLAEIPADQRWVLLTESIHLDGRTYHQGEKINLGQSILILGPSNQSTTGGPRA